MKIRIRYLSDLHLEIHGYPTTLPSVGEDLVVLAGDIATGRNGPARDLRSGQSRVLRAGLRAAGYGATAALRGLERAFFRMRFARHRRHPRARLHAMDGLPSVRPGARRQGHDRSACHDGGLHRDQALREALVPRDTVQRCAQSLVWLDQAITQAAEPLLVVTHHAPSLLTLNPNFAGDLSNGAFHNAFDHLLRPP